MAGQTAVRRIFGFRTRSTVEVNKQPAELSEKADAAPANPPPAPDSSDTSSDAAEDAPSVPVGLDAKKPSENARRRFTWLPLAPKAGTEDPKPTPPAAQDTDAPSPAAQEPEKKEPPKKKQPKAGNDHLSIPLARRRSDKRARESALLVRQLIVGTSFTALPNRKVKALSGTRIEKVRSQLAQPKEANKVIAQLRELPSSDEPVPVGTGPDGATLTVLPKGPIHAVCLPYPEAEVQERHFARLVRDAQPVQGAPAVERGLFVQLDIASVANASVSQLQTIFSELNIVSLLTAPDLGLGQPGDGAGILSGALPTAKTIIDGVEQITPQLLALGYATGKAILPDHAGVYPPPDRISVLTYWWGLEVVLPPPTIAYLDNVPSVAHAVINFLGALALVEGGVREILPFVRYISQFIDTEFSMIKQQNKGKGVVCAATWLMPAALVPRPWDFPDPPSPKATPPAEEAPAADDGASEAPPAPPSTSSPAPASEPTSEPSPNSPIILPSLSPPPIAVTAITTAPVDKTEVPPQDVPKVEITPPTPPTSETLRSATEGAFGEGGPATSASDVPADTA